MKRWRLLLGWACCLAGLAGSAVAATWSGVISSNVTWTRADSPHVVTADVILTNSATLTIEPGCQVILTNAAVDIFVYGSARIIAHGIAEAPITLGGLHRAAMGGAVLIYATAPSEFRYCTFVYMGYVATFKSTPYTSHLIEHCLFNHMEDYGVAIVECPTRVLNCIFRDVDDYAINLDYQFGMPADSVPTIWYNVFNCNAALNLARTVNYQYHLFFRFNRCTGAKGVVNYGYNVYLAENDLINCTSHSIDNWSSSASYMITNCTINAFENHAYPAAATLRNCWWGTTDMSVISNRLSVWRLSTNTVIPLATSNFFPQADVDLSDNNNATAQADADLVKQSLVGLTNLTPAQITRADVDRDGTVTLRDALMIESYVNGLIWKLPDPL